MEKNIFIMAGEASGDQHGAMLINSLKQLDENLHFYGVGGLELQAQGVSLLFNCSQFEAFGVIEPFLKLQFYRRALKNILSLVQEKNIMIANIEKTILYIADKDFMTDSLKVNGLYIFLNTWINL